MKERPREVAKVVRVPQEGELWVGKGVPVPFSLLLTRVTPQSLRTSR